MLVAKLEGKPDFFFHIDQCILSGNGEKVFLKDFDKLGDLWRERKKVQLSSLLSRDVSDAGALFLMSSSDWGVCRNGGRRGSRFAPEAISNVLKKMVAMSGTPHLYFGEVSSPRGEAEDFALAQGESTRCIKKIWDQFYGDRVFHMGGGHDHIFPLLMSLKDEKAIHVINIDAHLDTRAEPLFHSGTPFRQFADFYGGRFRLTQLGIHPFSNHPAAYDDLSAEMTVFLSDEFFKKGGSWREKISFRKEELTVLSLDCDALAAESMEAVSAVNPAGMSLDTVREIFEYYGEIDQKKKIYGIYEYNPLFDNLSQKGAKAIASLIYKALL